jgi:hypothetical protein
MSILWKDIKYGLRMLAGGGGLVLLGLLVRSVVAQADPNLPPAVRAFAESARSLRDRRAVAWNLLGNDGGDAGYARGFVQ